MTHYVALVLVPPEALTDNDGEEAVARLLAPYDENTEVPAYETKCHCVGMAALRRWQEGDAEGFKTRAAAHHDETRAIAGRLLDQEGVTHEELWEHPEMRAREEGIDALQAEHDAAMAAFMAEQEDAEAADADCTECGGSGLRATTYNPKSKWDWWVIGGRWEGCLDGDNARPVSEVLGNANGNLNFAYALVTPDGEWHSQGRMGWFGMSSDDKSQRDWQAEVKQLLEANREAMAVAVDLHI